MYKGRNTVKIHENIIKLASQNLRIHSEVARRCPIEVKRPQAINKTARDLERHAPSEKKYYEGKNSP